MAKSFLKINIPVLLVLIMLLNACTQFEDLKIDPISNYEFNGFNNNKLLFTLWAPVENPNNQNIVISEINLDVFAKNKPLGKIMSTDKIVFRKKEKAVYKIPVTIQITNLVTGFSLLSNPSAVLKNITFEGTIKGRKGIFIKTLPIDKTMSEQFIRF